MPTMMRSSALLGSFLVGILQYQTAAEESTNFVATKAVETLPYDAPPGVPRTRQSKSDPDLPHSASDVYSCGVDGTTTVFLTVYPSNNSPGSDASLPMESATDGTVFKTFNPTKTIVLSPVPAPSPTDTQSIISPFTTITVDLWGTMSHPTVKSKSTEGQLEVTAFSSESKNVNRVIPGYTVVTDSGIHWISGSTGPEQVTILSAHTITISSNQGIPSTGKAQSSCITVVGADGQTTVIDAASTALPTTESTVIASAPAVLASTTDFMRDDDLTTCTSYTTTGTDGLPNLVESTWTVHTDNPVLYTKVSTATAVALTTVPSQLSVDNTDSTSCLTYTVFGPNGAPTIVESTSVIEGYPSTAADGVSVDVHGQISASQVVPVTTIYRGGSGQVSLPQASWSAADVLTTQTTYTIIGPDGNPSVMESTVAVSQPIVTPFSQITVVQQPVNISVGKENMPAYSQQGDVEVNGTPVITTYTGLDISGNPVVVESTVTVAPQSAAPSYTSLDVPYVSPQQSGVILPSETLILLSSNIATTTCITVDVLGPNDIPTPTVQTIVMPPMEPITAQSATAVRAPPIVSQQVSAGLPNGVLSKTLGQTHIPSCITVDVLGTDGILTPLTQTILLTDAVPIFSLPAAAVSSSLASVPVPQEYQTINGYGSSEATDAISAPPFDKSPTQTPSFPLPQYSDAHSKLISTQPSSLEAYGPIMSNPPSWTSSALYGPVSLPTTSSATSFPNNITSVITKTWTNIIPEQTTTYTMQFPLTTLVTVTIPASLPPVKRIMRRQQSSPNLGSMWRNSSFTPSNAPSTTPLPTTSGHISANSSSTTSVASVPTVCTRGGDVGNFTIDFDEIATGPLLNPSGSIWFSEGFLIAPPSDSSHPYIPSSGGKMVEYVPAALSHPLTRGSADTAEVGLGPNSANPCFRINLYGANLGCATQDQEQWCEFDVSAYTYDENISHEQSIAWSETKRVPACSRFPDESCSLTHVDFSGYSNITGVLIKLRVGLDLRAWWGDDFRFGWVDNSCEASKCRMDTAPPPVKREVVDSVFSNGVWKWTQFGFEKLDQSQIRDAIPKMQLE